MMMIHARKRAFAYTAVGSSRSGSTRQVSKVFTFIMHALVADGRTARLV